jgi:hypothetical protein
MVVTELGIVTDVKGSYSNTALPKFVTELGIVNDVIPVPSKPPLAIVVKEFVVVTEVRLPQYQNSSV